MTRASGPSLEHRQFIQSLHYTERPLWVSEREKKRERSKESRAVWSDMKKSRGTSLYIRETDKNHCYFI
ncbi:hypothetical protein PUN28_005974 [Cardiocondyla obscurior]|uniref:Uncharacterized protein n=1 Tax=Cardiocondyla obscurior TaxID=286306 RepID=A0AAW2G8H3_9HYME